MNRNSEKSKAFYRILHVKGGRPLGGIGTFILTNKNALKDSNIIFDALLNGLDTSEGFDEDFNDEQSKVYIAPELKIRNFFKYLKYLKTFYRENSNKYSAVHIHSPNIAIFNLIYARKYGIKVRIIHSHNTIYSENKIKSIRNFILQIPNIHYTTHYAACGKEAAYFLFGKKRMSEAVIINNSLDLTKYKHNEAVGISIRKNLKLGKNFIIGHVGTFEYRKNHKFIVDLGFRLLAEKIDFKIILVGDGPLFHEINRQISESGLSEHIIALGRRNDVNDLLQAFDLFLLPSLAEGFPYVALEAQAAGIPSLISDTITKDVQVVQDVRFLCLDQPDKWIEAIVEIYKNKKKKFVHSFPPMYDIKDSSSMLRDYYINAITGGRLD